MSDKKHIARQAKRCALAKGTVTWLLAVSSLVSIIIYFDLGLPLFALNLPVELRLTLGLPVVFLCIILGIASEVKAHLSRCRLAVEQGKAWHYWLSEPVRKWARFYSAK